MKKKKKKRNKGGEETLAVVIESVLPNTNSTSYVVHGIIIWPTASLPLVKQRYGLSFSVSSANAEWGGERGCGGWEDTDYMSTESLIFFSFVKSFKATIFEFRFVNQCQAFCKSGVNNPKASRQTNKNPLNYSTHPHFRSRQIAAIGF